MCGCSSRTLADMTEDVREKFESLGISVKDVLQLRSGRRNQEAVQAHPLTPHFIVTSAGTRRGESSLPNRALRIARFHEDVRRPERDPAVQALPTLRPYTAVLWLHTPVLLVVRFTFQECSTSQQQLRCCSCGGNHTANYRGRAKWKETKAALDKRAPVVRSIVGSALSPHRSEDCNSTLPQAVS